MSKGLLPRRRLFILVAFACIFGYFIDCTCLVNPADARFDDLIHAFPDSALFVFHQSDSVNEKSANLYITSDTNATDIKAIFTDLRSTRGDTIQSVHLSLNPSRFNVSVLDMKSVEIKAALDSSNFIPGIYAGKVTLLSNEHAAVNIPIELRVIDDAALINSVAPHPAAIKFDFGSDMPKTNYIDLFLTTNNTLRNVNASFSDLRSDNGTIMQHSVLSSSPSKMNITAISPTFLRVAADVGGGTYIPGNYQGFLKLDSLGSDTFIPITIVIETPKIWYDGYGIAFVVVGIALSVFLILVREGSRIKESLEESASSALNALTAAISSNRQSKQEFFAGLENIDKGIYASRKNNYTEAISYLTKSKGFFDRATNKGPQVLVAEFPHVEDVERMANGSLGSSAAIRSVFRGDRLFFVAFSIVMTIVVLTTLQTVSPDVLKLNNFGSAIAAILVGFGSPAIANQLVPLFKK